MYYNFCFPVSKKKEPNEIVAKNVCRILISGSHMLEGKKLFSQGVI